METENFLELLPQLKTLVSSPETIGQAKTIVGSVPDMCYALIKIMVDLKLIDPQTTARILAGSATGASLLPQDSTAQPGPQTSSIPSSNPTRSTTIAHSAPSLSNMPPPYGISPRSSAPPQVVTTPSAPTPAVNNAAALLAALPEDQRNAMLAIIAMTPEQIRALPTNQATSLMELRRRFLGTD